MAFAIPFDNTYARLPDGFHSRLGPTPVRAPKLLAFNRDLGRLLGIPDVGDGELAQVFGGNALPEGSEPLAQLYAGHQFGHWTPQLGDGRAILLGEVVGADGARRDIQLKGAGRTPYSRSGDGRAWLGPVLREYVVSEAMHALGIPTTRALAAVATGETVFRETALPGAVLARVAASHLRVGTFEVLAARGRVDDLRRLTEYAIERHYPGADGPVGLLREVAAAQARLIPAWMAAGFVHGVMNTDNASISGETIDYGPCAFMDSYHPDTVFSSIDHGGRYAYARQPDIAIWNMSRLGTALVGQARDIPAAVDAANGVLRDMQAVMRLEWLRLFGAKIGLSRTEDGDGAMIASLLDVMARQRADFTNTFRNLGRREARDEFEDPSEFDAWKEGWLARVRRDSGPATGVRSATSDDGVPGDVLARLAAANPARIPRNHRIEEMIAAAVRGDMGPFRRLLAALSNPFEDREEWGDLAKAPMPGEVVHATFCGT